MSTIWHSNIKFKQNPQIYNDLAPIKVQHHIQSRILRRFLLFMKKNMEKHGDQSCSQNRLQGRLVYGGMRNPPKLLSSKRSNIYSSTCVLKLRKMTWKLSCTKPYINVKLLVETKVQMRTEIQHLTTPPATPGCAVPSRGGFRNFCALCTERL